MLKKTTIILLFISLMQAENILILDAGHGGRDIGVIKGGLREKDFTLNMAILLKKNIEQKGLKIKVILTRTSDYSLTPMERIAIANNNEGSLYISLHLNGSLDNSLTGIDIYYLDRDTEENEDKLLTWNTFYKKHKDNTLKFSSLLYDSFLEREVKECNVIGIPSILLKGLNMPAVVIELGFLTNQVEAIKLGTEEYKNKLCEAIISSISNYIKQ